MLKDACNPDAASKLGLACFQANSVDNTVATADTTADGQFYKKGSRINRHNIDVNVSNYALQDYLAAFRAAAKAGVKGMMCATSTLIFGLLLAVPFWGASRNTVILSWEQLLVGTSRRMGRFRVCRA